VLYTIAALLDFLDGSVARLTRRATRLGEILDMHWDGFGVLAASILLVLYTQVPPWYLLVGLARYLFVFGIWLRRCLGLPVSDLPPNVFRRALAGVQMGFIAVALLPVFTPPATWVAAALFALPLLVGFLRDWFFVSGVLDPTQLPGSWQRLACAWGPIVLRGLLILLLALVLTEQALRDFPLPAVMLVGVPALIALLLGAAGRIFGLGVLLMSGFSLQVLPLDWRFWTLMLLGAAVMTFGTGRFSLWKPEEWLIYHRIGDPSSTR
jgi:CDP-diacylglycerol--glycerol-3-phosphate 3-phosphatidyltransferase